MKYLQYFASLLTAALSLPLAAVTPISMTGLKAVGNQIHNAQGQSVFLHGVNRMGTEYACIQGWGFAHGPIDASVVKAMQGWNINAVRVPLNESCWLGINTTSAYAGAAYRQAIQSWVAAITQANMAAILEVHWTAPGSQAATGQKAMLNADHSLDLWRSVAETFKGNSAVAFDLHNEPFPYYPDQQGHALTWPCWRDGRGNCPSSLGFTAVGMQEVIQVVRSTGASNLILLSGVNYANDLSQMMNHWPTDPQNNLAASWHVYNFNICNTSACWNQTVAPVAARVPLVVAEVGNNQCEGTFNKSVMDFAQNLKQGYLAWVWTVVTPACENLSLIQDEQGTATSYGQLYKTHIQNLAWTFDGASRPPPTTPPTTSPTTPPASAPIAVKNPGFEEAALSPWVLQVNSAAAGSVALDTRQRQAGSKSARLTVTKASTSAWHVQLAQNGLSLTANQSYTLKFWAKADRKRNLQVVMQQGVAPYTSYFVATPALGTGWTLYTYSFKAPATTTAFLTFNVGDGLGKVWVDSVSIQ